MPVVINEVEIVTDQPKDTEESVPAQPSPPKPVSPREIRAVMERVSRMRARTQAH